MCLFNFKYVCRSYQYLHGVSSIYQVLNIFLNMVKISFKVYLLLYFLNISKGIRNFTKRKKWHVDIDKTYIYT